MWNRFRIICFAGLLMLATAAPALAGETTLTWHGHAAFTIVTPQGKVLMIDPWLKNPKNPHAQNGQDPVASVKKLDYIFITHGHFDHVGDAVQLAKNTGARLVANFELGTNLVKVQGFPKDQVGYDTLMNPGGVVTLGDGEVTVHLTPAIHSSGMNNPNAGPNDPDIVYGGNPAGVVLVIKGGPTIYHSGDTAYFLDMKLIGEMFHPDVALLNIGGHFGMEPDMAARAAVTVGVPVAIPHHYGTFPVLNQSTEVFEKGLTARGIRMIAPKPSESITFRGKEVVR